MTLSYDVTGYSCDLYYRDMDGAQHFLTGYELDLTDPEVYYKSDGRVYLYHTINLPESISKGEVFDLEVSFSKPKGTIELDSIYGFDSNWGGVSTPYSSVSVSNGNTSCNLTFKDVTPNGALKRIYINFWYTPSSDVTLFSSSITKINITEVSEKGLLNSIITLVKNIITGITELPSKIANSLKTFFDNIVNAVTSIGDLIKNAIVDLGNFLIDGVKSLFIPSEEDITNMKDKWDTLLSDRFGALYQVGALISDYASAFKEQSKNSITFPSVTIPLAGAEFTFGGWEVKVVPDGFSAVFSVLKTITSILATMLFINGLKNRFDKILGGADDI